MLFKYINYTFISIWLFCYLTYDLRFSAKYNFIPLLEVDKELSYISIQPQQSELKKCEYESILYESHDISLPEIYKTHTYRSVKSGGEFWPSECNSQFSVAIIVVYRNRSEQLRIFLNYFHHFLQRQKLHYRIFIVEQNDNKPFNRAKLFNIGVYEANRYKFPCVILHDVDLIPLNYANFYACTKQPRHMSANVDVHRYQLLYDNLFGGATALLTEQFLSVNGMSNEFHGWGGEDDDFYRRLVHNGYVRCRYDPKINKYIMLKHKRETPSADRYDVLRAGLQRYKQDGINSLDNFYRNMTLKHLYTHISVYN